MSQLWCKGIKKMGRYGQTFEKIRDLLNQICPKCDYLNNFWAKK